MLTEKRHQTIIKYVNSNNSVTVSELSEMLDISETTVRRDLNALAAMNKIRKVHGGATSIEENPDFIQQINNERENIFSEEKLAIARYAASTIMKNDFVFIDAGSTTEKMIDFISEPSAIYITNSFSHAIKLSKKKLRTYILGGQIKDSAHSVVGTECIEHLKNYNFNKCYIGTNGISLAAGFTTTDTDEAAVKRTVIEHSYVTYVLADHSKFNHVSAVTFSSVDNACIITDYLPDKNFLEKCIIKEVTE